VPRGAGGAALNALDRALADVHRALDGLAVPHMVIGGIANAMWGVPRATLDIDLTLWVEDAAIPDVIASLCARFACLAERPEEFVRQTRVLPIDVQGVKADLILGLLPYERAAIDRAVRREVGGEAVPFCTAEDLILHKIVSTRDRDRDDVREVLRVQRGRLDLAYLEPRVRELATLLDRPSLWDDYLTWR
jgi:hypothetical protein